MATAILCIATGKSSMARITKNTGWQYVALWPYQGNRHYQNHPNLAATDVGGSGLLAGKPANSSNPQGSQHHAVQVVLVTPPGHKMLITALMHQVQSRGATPKARHPMETLSNDYETSRA